MIKLAKTFALIVWYFIASIIILIAVLSALTKAVTPLLNDHKATVESLLSKQLKQKVVIGSIEAKWVQFGPEFHFNNIVLFREDKPYIAAQELTAHIGLLQSLVEHTLVFRQLVLDHTQLTLIEVKPHQYTLNQFPLFQDNSDFNPKDFLAWLGAQNQLQLTNIQFSAQLLNQPKFSLLIEQAKLYKATDNHPSKDAAAIQNYIFSAMGIINHNSGNQFDLISHFKGQLTQFNQLQGQVYFHLKDLPANTVLNVIKQNHLKNLANLKNLRAQGQLDLTIWTKSVGDQLQQLQAKFAASDFALQQTEGEVKTLIPTQDFDFVLGWFPDKPNVLNSSHYQQWKAVVKNDQYQLLLDHHPEQYFEHNYPTQIQFNSLDLTQLQHILLPIADSLKLLPTQQLALIKQLNLQGELQQLIIHVPEIAQLKNYQDYIFNAQFKNITSQAYQQYPGISQLSGQVFGSLAHGRYQLAIADGQFDQPEYFSQPLVIKQAELVGNWHYDPKQFLLQAQHAIIHGDVFFANANLLFRQLLTPAATKSTKQNLLSIVGGFQADNLAVVKHSLPVNLFPTEVKDWLDSALHSGKGGSGTVVLRGPLADFPYANHEGVFMVNAQMQPTELQFSSDWPAAQQLAGSILFHNQAMDAQLTQGALQGLAIDQATVSIPNYLANPTLYIQGKAQAPAQDYLQLIHTSPLEKLFGHYFTEYKIKLDGNLINQLQLSIPLVNFDPDKVQANGTVQFRHNTVTWERENNPLVLKQFNGTVKFANQEISASQLTAHYQNNPWVFTVAPILQTDNQTQTKAQTKSKSNAHSEPQFIATKIIGSGKIAAHDIAQLINQPSINQTSINHYLSGQTAVTAALTLPNDLTKQAISIKLQSDLLGMAVNLPYEFHKTAQQSKPLLVTASIDPAYAYKAQFKIQYQNALDAQIGYHYLTQEKAQQWQVDSAIVKGSAIIPDNKTKLAKLDLAYLKLHFPETQTAKTTEKSKKTNKHTSKQSLKFNPLIAKKFQPLALTIQDFSINQYYLGKLQLTTQPIINGIAIQLFKITNPLYKFTANGQWEMVGNQATSHLKGEFAADDLSKVLAVNKIFADKLNGFQAKQTAVNYDLTWPDNLWALKLASVHGTLNANVKDGVIPVGESGSKMGLGKALSLFSAQSLERRLKLDFSDLSSNGYSFNTMVADLSIKQGNAYIDNGEFNGPQAKINMLGRIGLAQKDYDLKLTIIPYVTSSLPVLAAFAGGPVVGVAAYAANKLVGQSIDKLTAYHYLVHGPWAKPELINLDQVDKEKAKAKAKSKSNNLQANTAAATQNSTETSSHDGFSRRNY